MKTKTTFTPGPWVTSDHAVNGRVVYDQLARFVAVCPIQSDGDLRLGSPHTPEAAEANARLIATAPEMLELIKRLNYAFYAVGTPKAMKEVMAETKGLIAKAEGRE